MADASSDEAAETPEAEGRPRAAPSYAPSKEEYVGISAGALDNLDAIGDARSFAEMIVDTVREGLLVLDFDLCVKAANESFYRTFGVAPEETVGRRIYDLGNGQWDLPELHRLLEGILPEAKAFNDYEVDHAFDGIGRRVMLLNGRRLNDHRLILLAFEDVTARRAGERALSLSETAFRHLADAVPQLVWTARPNGAIEFYNRRATLYAGLRPSDDGTWAWAPVLHPDDRGTTVEAWRAAVAEGTPYEVEHRLRMADGTYRWHVSRALPVQDAGGRVERWYGTATDVHRVKEAEEALRASEARQAFLLRLSDALRQLADPEAIQYEAARTLGAYLGASRVGYAEDQGDGETVTVRRHYTDGVPGLEGVYHYSDYGPALLAALRAGRIVVRGDVANDPTLTEAEKAAHAELQLGALVIVPLVKGERLVAVLFVHHREAHDWSAGEVALLEAVAERTWAAVERGRAEERLRRSYDTFFHLIQNAPFGVYVVDAAFRLVQVSAGARKVFEGVRPLLGRDFAEVLRVVWPEPFASEAIAHFRHTLATGEPYHAPGTIERRSNVDAVESYDWRIERVTLPDGRHGVVCYFYDYTALTHAEEALRASEERLRLALDVAELGTWSWDLATGEGGLDARGAEIVGLPPGDLADVAEAQLSTIHPDDLGRVLAEIEAGVAAGGTFTLAYRTAHPDGSVHHVLSRARVVPDEAGRPARLVGTNRDVTAEREAEAALRAANETLEARVRERTREVRSLVRALTLAEQQERRRIAHVLHDDLQQVLYGAKMMARMGADAERIAALLDEATALTRALSHELSPPLLESEDLRDVLHWLAEQEHARYGLEVAVEAGPVPVPEADLRILLFQLVRELLFNVVKHAGTRQARIVATRADGHVRIVVEDEGKGFSPETLDGTGARGLGIPSVRRRLELVGGRLGVDSAPGSGTRITMEAPLLEA